MAGTALFLLILLFFVTSVIGVVTGSNSLITVPVMFQFGIDPRVAVATNMFGLTFMNIGATLPFLRQGVLDRAKITPLVVLTLIASAIGALLVFFINAPSMKIIVSVAMIAVTLFTILRRNEGQPQNDQPTSSGFRWITYVLTFFLGIYGGLYSGGYVTMLTAVLVAFYGLKFSESVAATKLINIFSSGIATLIFMWQGLVDYKLGLILAVTMFVGAYVGAQTVTKLSEIWLKRIFVGAVLMLATKTLFDYFVL